MVLRAFLFALMLSFGGHGSAQDQPPVDADSIDYNSGILVDYNYAYYLKAARGWIMDDAMASENGWSTAMYPDSFTSSNTPVVVFSLVYFKDDSIMTVRNVIEACSQHFESYNKNSVIRDCDAVVTKGGDTAYVRSFAGAAAHDYQMIAFLNVTGGAIAIILASHDEMGIESNAQGFREIVGSYVFLSNNASLRNNEDSTRAR